MFYQTSFPHKKHQGTTETIPYLFTHAREKLKYSFLFFLQVSNYFTRFAPIIYLSTLTY